MVIEALDGLKPQVLLVPAMAQLAFTDPDEDSCSDFVEGTSLLPFVEADEASQLVFSEADEGSLSTMDFF